METVGPDLIVIEISDTRAFPSCKYNTLIKIETQKGVGESYIKDVLGYSEFKKIPIL